MKTPNGKNLGKVKVEGDKQAGLLQSAFSAAKSAKSTFKAFTKKLKK